MISFRRYGFSKSMDRRHDGVGPSLSVCVALHKPLLGQPEERSLLSLLLQHDVESTRAGEKVELVLRPRDRGACFNAIIDG